MSCKNCNSDRVASVCGKTSDMCFFSIRDKSHDGYVPRGVGIGGGDYIDFSYCLNCGQIQDSFPVEHCDVEIEVIEDDY